MILGHQSGILFEAQAQNGADEYSNGALAWISAGALPSIGGAQVRINGAFGLEYSELQQYQAGRSLFLLS